MKEIIREEDRKLGERISMCSPSSFERIKTQTKTRMLNKISPGDEKKCRRLLKAMERSPWFFMSKEAWALWRDGERAKARDTETPGL